MYGASFGFAQRRSGCEFGSIVHSKNAEANLVAHERDDLDRVTQVDNGIEPLWPALDAGLWHPPFLSINRHPDIAACLDRYAPPAAVYLSQVIVKQSPAQGDYR
ncbi:hypothetical protein WI95_04070 [Burkholderia contaminans]|nr:hypothetical protein WI95_04070 [Burkholderia contaminans]TCW73084.1 hypothetical protein C5O79_03980 [Burkholderia sp. SRS-25]